MSGANTINALIVPKRKQRNKIGSIILMGLAVLALVGLGVYLFFGEQILYYLQTETEYINGHAAVREETEELVIGYAFPHDIFDPTFLDPANRDHLIDMYEGLVKTDRNLNIDPGLAVSWGLVDPLTWEFKIRKGVKFHDGRALTTDDVIASINRATDFEESQLRNLLNSIDDVYAVDEERLRIVTNAPDPLMLQKLAVTLIHPEDFDSLLYPPGTGPYKFVSSDKEGLRIEAFKDYWGAPPVFKKAYLRVIPDRRERIAALENNEIQFVVNFPPNVGCSLFEGYKNIEGCRKVSNPDLIAKSIPGRGPLGNNSTNNNIVADRTYLLWILGATRILPLR